MVDTTFRELAEKLIPPVFDTLRSEARDEVSRKSAELVTRGSLRPGAAVSAVHTICVNQIEKRAAAVCTVMMRVMERVVPSYSATLASDLKQFLDSYVPLSLWELPKLYAKMGGKDLYDKQFAWLLLEARERVLQKWHAEIDLYVEGVRSKRLHASSTIEKERDQKFGILLSPNQALIDFDAWKNRLSSGDRSIAVLYLDIDRFKDFNTRYTETLVDKTILPTVLRLLADLVDQRGEGYKQGGDEFVLILPNCDKIESIAFAEKVRSRIASLPIQVGDETTTLTVSGGVANWPEHGATYDAVLLKANEAKRTAKETRNTIILA